MSNKGSSLSDLVTLYLDKKRQGESLTAEEACPGDPSQQAEVRREGQAVLSMEAFLGVASDGTDSASEPTVKPLRKESPPLTGLVANYEILGELGRGGMGIVYKARQVGLERIVALKVLRSGSDASVKELERFRGEATAAGGLQHPNIVQVHDIGEHNGQPFFSMEFIAGGNLGQHLEAGPLAPRPAAELVATLARAVHFAHQHGVIHRDLKPANILLAPASGRGSLPNPRPEAGANRVPKITDFGLAKRLDSEIGLTKSGAIQGTPSYMAPEQAHGEQSKIGPLTDVWALGIILFECLAGQTPFHSPSVIETLDRVCHRDPVPPSRHRPTVHRDLDTICLKCLHKEPGQRYASAAELADDLQRFLDGEPIEARPASWSEQSWRWCRRRPTVAALLGVALLFVLIGLPLGIGTLVHLDDLRQQQEITEEKAKLATLAEAAARDSAINQEYFSLLHQVREGTRAGRLGWKESGLKALERAARLQTPKRNLVDLRTEAAACLGGVDLLGHDVLVKDFLAESVCASPNGKFLAIGQFKAGIFLWLYVHLLNLNSGEVRVFSVPVGVVMRSSGLVQDGVYSLAFRPDSQMLAAGTRSGQIVRWDLSQQPPKEVSWKAHKDTVAFLAFTPEGDALVSGSGDSLVKCWDPRTGQVLKERALPSKIEGLAMHPDGKRLTCTCGGHIHELDVRTLEPVKPASPESSYGRICYSPNGQILAVAMHDGIELRNAETGSTIRKLGDATVGCAHCGVIDSLLFNDDGSLLVSTSSAETDRKLKLWETASGRQLVVDVIDEPGAICPAFVPGERSLVHAGGRQIVRRAIGGLREQTFLAHHGQAVRAISATEATLACASAREMPHLGPCGAVTLWNLVDGKKRGHLEMGGVNPDHFRDRPLALAPEGNRLAVSGSDARDIQVWDPNTGQIVERLAARNAWNLTWSRDGQRLWGDGENFVVQSWEWPDGRLASSWSNFLGHHMTGRGNINCVHAGQRWVLAGIRNGSVVAIPAMARGHDIPVATWEAYTSSIRRLALNKDETVAAVGCLRGPLRLLEVPSGRLLAESKDAHGDSVEGLAFAAEGRLLASGSRDGTVRLWDCAQGTLEPVLTLRFPGPVKDVHMDADGRRLLVLVQNETAVRVWHLDALRQRLAALGIEGW